jgi:acetyl-CoA carboxylase carboxyltransferase component
VPYDRQHAVTISDHVHRLRQVREQAIQGDDLATTRQHRKGKLTARERLEHLLDEGSFAELDIFRRSASDASDDQGAGQPFSDGVVTGSGAIHGVRVFAYAQDFRTFGGSLG